MQVPRSGTLTLNSHHNDFAKTHFYIFDFICLQIASKDVNPPTRLTTLAYDVKITALLTGTSPRVK